MKKQLIFIYLIFSGLASASAQSLEALLTEAAANNPRLKALYAQYQASLEKVPQVGVLPDPELSLAYFPMPMERYMGIQRGDVTLMQMFPWPGTLRANRQEAGYMADMQRYAYEEASLQLAHDVHTAYFQLYQLDREIAFREQELALFGQYEELLLTAYTAGNSVANSPAPTAPSPSSPTASPSSGGSMSGMGGGPAAPSASPSGGGMGSAMPSSGMAAGGNALSDLFLVKSQRLSLENQLFTLRSDRQSQEARMRALLNRTDRQPIAVTDTLAPPQLTQTASSIADAIRQSHPMLKMFESEQRARQAQQQMAKQMGKPMLGIGVNYMVLSPREAMGDEMLPMDNGRNMIMPMAKITLPIYRKKYQAQQQEARFLEEAAQWNQQSTEQQLLADLEDWTQALERAQAQARLAEQQLALAEQALAMMTAAYASGGLPLSSLIQQEQALISYRIAYMQSVVNQHVILASLYHLMGEVHDQHE